jgi:phosphoglucosamine mutase
VLGLIAQSWRDDQRLRGQAVVATVMSNLGLETYLAGLGLGLRRTKVGDRYVVERMREDGCNVGGEQSGHIVLSDFATTGDGLLAALQVLAVARQRDRPASEVGQVFAPLPQRLTNVRSERRLDLARPEIVRLLDREQARLDGRGRLLVRASGTEPVVRVMVEAEDEALLTDVLETVSREIGRLAAQAA